MKITNYYNLPEALFNLAQEQKRFEDNTYSATTIIKPIREVILLKRHFDEIEQDVSDLIQPIFGTAVHKIIEAYDKTGYSEIKLEHILPSGVKLTGRVDLYNSEEYTVEDWKVTNIAKILRSDFEEWKLQGLIYAWLLMRQGKYVNKLRFHALIKDWNKRESLRALARGDFYPEHAIWTWEFVIHSSDIAEIEQYIHSKIKLLGDAEKMLDDEPPVCSASERWNTGDSYAIIRKGRKSAVRVFNNEQDAKQYLPLVPGCEIEVRKGRDIKCDEYCQVREFCNYAKDKGGI